MANTKSSTHRSGPATKSPAPSRERKTENLITDEEMTKLYNVINTLRGIAELAGDMGEVEIHRSSIHNLIHPLAEDLSDIYCDISDRASEGGAR